MKTIIIISTSNIIVDGAHLWWLVVCSTYIHTTDYKVCRVQDEILATILLGETQWKTFWQNINIGYLDKKVKTAWWIKCWWFYLKINHRQSLLLANILSYMVTTIHNTLIIMSHSISSEWVNRWWTSCVNSIFYHIQCCNTGMSACVATYVTLQVL